MDSDTGDCCCWGNECCLSSSSKTIRMYYPPMALLPPIFRYVSIIPSQNERVRNNDLSSTEFQSSSISCPGCILVDVVAGSSIKCAHLCSATGCFVSLPQKPLLPQQMRNRFFMSPPSDASRHPCSSAWRGPGPFLQTKIASRAAARSPAQPSPAWICSLQELINQIPESARTQPQWRS